MYLIKIKNNNKRIKIMTSQVDALLQKFGSAKNLSIRLNEVYDDIRREQGIPIMVHLDISESMSNEAIKKYLMARIKGTNVSAGDVALVAAIDRIVPRKEISLPLQPEAIENDSKQAPPTPEKGNLTEYELLMLTAIEPKLASTSSLKKFLTSNGQDVSENTSRRDLLSLTAKLYSTTAEELTRRAERIANDSPEKKALIASTMISTAQVISSQVEASGTLLKELIKLAEGNLPEDETKRKEAEECLNLLRKTWDVASKEMENARQVSAQNLQRVGVKGIKDVILESANAALKTGSVVTGSRKVQAATAVVLIVVTALYFRQHMKAFRALRKVWKDNKNTQIKNISECNNGDKQGENKCRIAFNIKLEKDLSTEHKNTTDDVTGKLLNDIYEFESSPDGFRKKMTNMYSLTRLGNLQGSKIELTDFIKLNVEQIQQGKGHLSMLSQWYGEDKVAAFLKDVDLQGWDTSAYSVEDAKNGEESIPNDIKTAVKLQWELLKYKDDEIKNDYMKDYFVQTDSS